MKERVMTDPKQLVSIELKNAGFDISDIKTLPALHSFLSILVLVSKEYDSGITEKLLLFVLLLTPKLLWKAKDCLRSLTFRYKHQTNLVALVR